jgi:tRNA(Ile)-lysidine synthase TilS/MesJ
VENDTILRLAGQRPYDPATEKRCRPLVDASEAELSALLAAHELRKAEALSNQVPLAKQQPRCLHSSNDHVCYCDLEVVAVSS